MKKYICRTWSVVLAALVCLALLPVTVHAEETVVATATIPVRVAVTGEDIPKETYTIQIEKVTENAPLPTQTTLTITGAGSASFSIAYESTGIYQYKVTQNTSALTAGNGHYDTTVYYVKVYVIELEDGSIGTEVKVYKGSASGDKCDELVFANTYDSVPGGGSSGGGSSKTTDGTVSSTEAVTAQTGDNAHIALYALVMIVALAGILFLVISIRRKKTE